LSDTEGIIKGMTLETTLFDRLLKLHGPGIKRMLTTQYRMHENIMRFPSDQMYESKLVAADSVKDRILKDLPYDESVSETEDTIEPLIFFDTQGGDFPEKNEDEEVDKKAGKGMMGDSKSNGKYSIITITKILNRLSIMTMIMVYVRILIWSCRNGSSAGETACSELGECRCQA